MPRKKTFEVNVTEVQRNHLENLISSGTAKARLLTRARNLLKADESWTDKAIQAALICVVQDNLSTHKPASLYEAFPAEEARSPSRLSKFVLYHPRCSH